MGIHNLKDILVLLGVWLLVTGSLISFANIIGINCSRVSTSFNSSIDVNDTGNTDYSISNLPVRSLNMINLFTGQCSGLPNYFTYFYLILSACILYLGASYLHG